MRTCVFFVVSIMLASPSSAALVGKLNLGLYGAWCEGLATFDLPGPINRVYADLLGTNTLYYTEDRGVTWTPAISGEDLYGIATDSTYIYANVHNEIWRSVGSDGLTWAPILTPTTAVYTGEGFSSIQYDGTRLMVGCTDGIAYFNATGSPTGWSRISINPTTPAGNSVTCITSRPSDPNTLLAVINAMDHAMAASNELHLSTDGGVTWTPVVLPATITRAIEVVGIDPLNPDDVYLAGDSAWATIYLNRLFVDPTAWIDITPTSFQSGYPQQIEFHSGLTWTMAQTYDVATGTWAPSPLTTVGSHINDGALAFDPDDPLVVFSASDIGIAVSEDGGVTFEERNDGLEGLTVFDVDVNVVGKNVALVASKSGVAITNGFIGHTPPADWSFPVFPQGTGGAPLTAAAIVHGSLNEFVIGDSGGTLYLSQDAGVTWTDTYTFLLAPILSRSSANDIDSAPGSDVLYAAIGFWEFGNEGRIVRSGDRGQTWTETTLTGVHPNTLEIVGTTLIYTGVGHELTSPSAVNEGIYASNDSGATWNRIGTTTGPIPGIVTELAQDPVNPAVQYAAMNYGTGPGGGGGAVMRLEYDASGIVLLSNTDISATYGGPTMGRFTALETNDLGTEVYVAVEQDVHLFDVATSTWSLYLPGLPGEIIYALYWDELVVCTSTGFYGFDPDSDSTSGVPQWRKY